MKHPNQTKSLASTTRFPPQTRVQHLLARSRGGTVELAKRPAHRHEFESGKCKRCGREETESA